MIKVAIITTHHSCNYGNKLQNYALQMVLKGLGVGVETINDARFFKDLISWKSFFVHLICIVIRRNVGYHKKGAKFFLWSKKHLKYSKVNLHKDGDMQLLPTMYDYFVVGADQIWNPEWRHFSNDFGFAAFARKEQKIAYAPSFGVSEMLEDRIEEYRKYLSEWKAISCREYEGAEIIKDLVNIDVPVVVDPTLLIPPKYWDSVAECPVISDGYAFVYLIGVLEPQYQQHMNVVLKKYGIKKIIDLSERNVDVVAGPGEFVGLVKNAKVVITDSFHGSVFSLLYHRPITIFVRHQPGEKDKMSRLRTLFTHANIEPRDFKNEIYDYHQVDWEQVDKALEIKRNEGIEYLKRNLI